MAIIDDLSFSNLLSICAIFGEILLLAGFGNWVDLFEFGFEHEMEVERVEFWRNS